MFNRAAKEAVSKCKSDSDKQEYIKLRGCDYTYNENVVFTFKQDRSPYFTGEPEGKKYLYGRLSVSCNLSENDGSLGQESVSVLFHHPGGTNECPDNIWRLHKYIEEAIKEYTAPDSKITEGSFNKRKSAILAACLGEDLMEENSKVLEKKKKYEEEFTGRVAAIEKTL